MRIRFSPALLALIWCTAAIAAAETPAQKPAPKPRPLPAGVTAEYDVKYVPDGDKSQALDIYYPEKASEKPQPLLVWIHGGGWSAGSKSGCRYVNEVPRGYIAASVEYRFSQKAIFPAQAQDCQAAIRWLRANAKKYNIDPQHIGIGGDSAGGHLVALLGTEGGKKAFPPIGGNEDQSDRVQAVEDLYGPADFYTVVAQATEDKTPSAFKAKWNHGDPYSNLIGGGLGLDKEKCDAVSPTHYVSKDNPPFLILHGDHDALVPYAQSIELTDLLTKAGVEVTLQRIPGAGHGGPAFGLPAVNKLVDAFFDKHLKGVDAKIEPLPDSEVTVKPKVAPAPK
jgi:acetyl esterase/lipase